MNRILFSAMLVLSTASVMSAAGAAPANVPWVNGDFELGGAAWGLASTTTIEDADGDGDQEAVLRACGDGAFQLSRGASMGPVPATSDLAFSIDAGQLDFYDIRVILIDTQNPEGYLNNYALAPNWLDDQVLSWYSWSSPLSGNVVLDPVDAVGFNIPGWGDMTAEEREARLGDMLYTTLVVYACTNAGAAVDDFHWVL